MAEASGNEILSYRGDPGLAAGAGTELMPVQVNPLAGVDSALDKIQATNQQKSLIDYNNKIKSQEDLAKMLAETGGSVFNMKNAAGQNASFTPLPDDQKILTEKAHDLRRMILENPDNYQFNEDYLTKRKELDNLTSHAGVRAQAYSTYNQDAAKTNDPDERNNILALRKLELDNRNLGDYHMPEPYLPRLTSDPEKFIASKDAQNEKNKSTYHVQSGKDAQGNLLYNSLDGLNDNILDFRAKIYPGSPAWPDAINYTRDYLQHIAADPNAVMKHNANIDAINAARGYVDAQGNPINQHYIPHVADVVPGPNGQMQVVSKTTNPADVAYALMAEKYGSLQGDQTIKKSKDELDKEASAIANQQSEIKRRAAQTAESWAALDEKRREWDNPHEKAAAMTKEQAIDNRNKQAALSVYKQVQAAMNTDNAQQVKYVRPEKWQEGGVDPKKYNIYKIPDKTADKFVGIQASDVSTKVPDGNGGFITKTKKGQSIQPDGAYILVDKKTGEKKLTYLKDGVVASVVSEKDAIVNGLKHDAKWDPKEYENRIAVVDQIYGEPSQQPASAVAPQAPSKPPQPVEELTNIITSNGTAVAAQLVQHPTLGGIYVDKKNKKIYDASTGAEIKIK